MADSHNLRPLFSPEVVTHPDGTISVLSAQANETITRSIQALRQQSDADAGKVLLAMPQEGLLSFGVPTGTCDPL